METWKPITGYENLYEVSDFGNVKRVKNSERCKNSRLLKLKTKSSGYKFVCLSKGGIFKYFHVHRLVACAFIENKDNKLFVNHKDMNKANNNLSNLEWVTAYENNIHARRNKVFKINSPTGLNNKKSVCLIQKKENKIVFVWVNSTEASKYYYISSSSINKAKRNGTICLGFHWIGISNEDYIKLSKNNPNAAPIYNGNKRERDLSKAKIARFNNLSKMDKMHLIKIGIGCIKKYKRLIRKDYDCYAKEQKSLTYVPTCKRFGGWINFKNAVTDNLIDIV